MIRVLYILNATDRFGGATKAIMNLLDGMPDIIPHFILPEDSGIAEVLQQKGIPYSVLNYRLSVYPPLLNVRDVILFLPRLCGRLFLNARAAHQLSAIAKDTNADIIHTNTGVNSIGYQASRILGIPHVWHIREYGILDFDLHHYPCESVFRHRLKTKQSYSICITKDIQRYNNLEGWPCSRVIYDGVLHADEVSFNLPKQDYFLFAGRLEEGKGIEELLSAYRIYCDCTDHPVPLWIAGDTQDTEYKRRLISIAGQSACKDSIHFLGVRKDILSLMQNALSLIVPSRAEGFGFITAEGMFSGALVIGKNVRGTKEQFDNGYDITKQDIALKYLSETELVKHMLNVTQQGIEPYIHTIKAGQAVARQLYSVENHQEAVYQFYCDIIGKKSK